LTGDLGLAQLLELPFAICIHDGWCLTSSALQGVRLKNG